MIDADIVKIIQNNYKISNALNGTIQKEKNIDEKLKLIRFAALYNATNQTSKFSDGFIENELIKISNMIEFENCNGQYVKNTTLHVMTECNLLGGHTRVVDNWIRFDKKRNQSILFIKPQTKMPKWLEENVLASKGVIMALERKNDVEKAKELFRIASCFEKIVLHTNKEEYIHILAFGNDKWKRPIFCFNQADSSFWLGASIADVVLEISDTRGVFSSLYRGVSNSRTLLVPINEIKYKENISLEDKYKIKAEFGLPDDSYIVTSMAREIKYTDFKPYDFFEFCERVIELNPKIYILLIGCGMDRLRWERLYRKGKGRIIPLGEKDKDDVLDILQISDYYVDSFFTGSLTSILEAIAFKLPCSTLSPLMDFEFCEVIKKEGVGDIIADISRHFKGEKNEEITVELEKYLKENYRRNWVNRLEKIYKETKNQHTIQQPKIVEHKILPFEIEFYKSHYNRETDYMPVYMKIFNDLTLKNKIKIIKIFLSFPHSFIHIRKNTIQFREELNFSIMHQIKVYPEWQNYNVAVYGTANWGKKCTKVLKHNRIKIRFYIDSDKAKTGMRIWGKKIIHPEMLPAYIGKCDKIIIASSAYREIIQTLKLYGVKEKDIIYSSMM